MMLSMTGYSHQTVSIQLPHGTLQAHISLKSLNARFFEATCKLPHAFSHLEPQISKKLKKKLYRGNVYCTVFSYNPHVLKSHMRPSDGMIQSYLEGIQHIQHQYNIPGELEINRFMALPYVFETHEEPFPPEATQQVIETIDHLIEHLIQDRKQEGATLYQDIMERLDTIDTNIKQLEERFHTFLKERRAKLLQQVPESQQSASEEAREHHMHMIHAQLDKIDIHEEIVRFKNHINNMYSHMTSDAVEKGKRLDFILQELFREINTINAKCSDAELSNLAIAMKFELEKAREQVQNVV